MCFKSKVYYRPLFSNSIRYFREYAGIPWEKKNKVTCLPKIAESLCFSGKVEFGLDLEIDMQVSIICVECGRARWRERGLALQSEPNRAQLCRENKIYMLFSENRLLGFNYFGQMFTLLFSGSMLWFFRAYSFSVHS